MASLETYVGRGAHDYRVIIPSVDRPAVLCNTTLHFLINVQAVPPERIHVWVADATLPRQTLPEKDRYADALQSRGWDRVQLRVGVLGLTAQWNHIVNAYPQNTYIVCVLDNVRRIHRCVESRAGRKKIELASPLFKALVQHAGDLCHRHGSWMWGLCPAQSLMSMSPNGISRKFGLVQNAVLGFWTRRDPSLCCKGFCLDLEYSCRYWQSDGILLRYEMLCASRPYGTAGGQSTVAGSGRREVESTHIQKLAREFPHLLKYAPEKGTKTVQPVRIFPVGPSPLQLKTETTRQVIFAKRPASSTEKYRRSRGLPLNTRKKLKPGRKPLGKKAMSRAEIS
eukprot:785484-Pyramimonas_sp.AAC.1